MCSWFLFYMLKIHKIPCIIDTLVLAFFKESLRVVPALVWDLLLQLDPCKSIGPNGIHPRILKELVGVIAQPLSMIFEQSWESREVPADWKLVEIVLIFNYGKKEDPKIYSPVSLTSVPSKILEKIVLGSIE
ncbi:RNA-directed DNA polymerase from mobile element jockey [Pitangus sulphuratus]|nr:RNA-directed DNA polymerase from mobile element jockey [Pitangus sulphuratus]